MRVSDLFSSRAILIVQTVQVESQQRAKRAGVPDADIVALSADGLTLRQIADRVGLSHETVRRRLQEPVGAR
jgi:DNA-binding NarL/FixJ family response regulator